MKFEWDESKNEANLAKHGVDFNYALLVFFDKNRLEWEDTRKDYGEVRHLTIGRIDEIIYTLVYTFRKEHYRLISARGARKDERQTYYRYLKRNG